jgi:LmbE family N-acetylglucosaminyl deacetylase
MKILAIGPHPDDIEIGCAGTLTKYAERSHDIFYLLITRGKKGGKAQVRCEEQIKAANIIGAREVFWGGFEDTELMDKGNEIIQTVESYIKKIQPHFIFVNFCEDTHQDHRIVNRSVLSATRYVKNVLFYEVPTTNNFNPNVFVDIGTVLDKKMEALRAHASQIMKTNIEDLSILDIAKSSAHFRGVQGRVPLAEGFVSERLFINID